MAPRRSPGDSGRAPRVRAQPSFGFRFLFPCAVASLAPPPQSLAPPPTGYRICSCALRRRPPDLRFVCSAFPCAARLQIPLRSCAARPPAASPVLPPLCSLPCFPLLASPVLPRRSKQRRQQCSRQQQSEVQGMISDFGEDMHCQFLEILKILMDGFAMNTATLCRGVIDVFHEKHLDKLIDVVALSSPLKDISQSTSSVCVGTRVDEQSAKPEILSNICELLCFCVVHHPYKIKVNLLRGNSMEKILTLTCRRERFLVVSAVRFMRTVIGRNDELLFGHVIKFNLLKPIIEAFGENGDRYNMLHSGVLELLEYIRKENKSLVIHVTESFWDKLVRFEKLGSIQAFKLKYQQIMESAETKQSTGIIDMRMQTEQRGVDKEEEDYFNKGSDEEDSARWTCSPRQSMDKLAKGIEIDQIPARSKSGGLVDYDNGDDEGYNPPPKKNVKADEDDEALIVKRSAVDDKQTRGNSPKKPKLEPRIICSKIVPLANVTGMPSDLADKQYSLSPASSMKSSEGNVDVGEEDPGSQSLQHALESLDSTHQNGDDCSKDPGNLSPEMAVHTTKSTDCLIL
ncbi:hypothetical protein GUJ93_ZPchr0010g9553 [Zizania palustris]|uniref:Serine/threonine-protein phosphatase 4 regulatory subunit 3-like central domain-containing protein n=1 Tax=Zizania palustris TaxID=103762 RepID=A0A8J5W8L2_ZIZPA|nr:hypothetical protein GUJ93_ZPchr0010g9553 [Zizania palustris]